jgi:hypothetical protein
MVGSCSIVLTKAMSFWHLRRKAAWIDAEIDERVNGNSADERGDYDYQHFQTDGTHTGSVPKAGLSIKSGDSKKNTAATSPGWVGADEIHC